MLKCNWSKRILKNYMQIFKRQSHDQNLKKIRNIGILAHIDAGKTTTTERMLFYSGKTTSLGEVHHGTTITDYLSQERERGITICSSAVTFQWNGHRINLLDTPGHIDFTMEVEQSLFAVDGTVVILDGSAGVEAQTITVWTQAERHNLPKIVFVNKMDRPDANFEECLKDLSNKLDTNPLAMQWPLEGKKGVEAVIDLKGLKLLTWDPDSQGQKYNVLPLPENLVQQAKNRRIDLIDKLSGLDDKLAEEIIAKDSIENVPNELIDEAIKRLTVTHRIVPVFLGASYKNIGVQSLMDGVNEYLPSPDERNQLYNCFGDNFAGKVFKVVHDKQRGPLSLVRILRGNMKKGMRLVTMHGSGEVLQRMYEPLADEYREISSASTGDVCVCAGLKNTNTGDLLVTSISHIRNAEKNLLKMLGKSKSVNTEQIGEDVADDLSTIKEILSLQPEIPDAVYFCAIEPPSLSYQIPLDNALKQLQREDPSLRVKYDEITGQTVLGGMGELHLEIIKSRILTDYKIDADLGPLQIAYKETIEEACDGSFSTEKEIAGSKQQVNIQMQLVKDSNEVFKLENSIEAQENLNLLRPRHLQIIKKGAIAALERGPRLGGSVVDTQIILQRVTIGRGTADSFLMAAAGQCIQKILSKSLTRLLEPIMSIHIIVPTERVSSILGDLGRRRANILDVRPKGNKNKVIELTAPLAELTGYSSILRTISSGTASMTMQPKGYAHMNEQDETIAVRKAQGLE